MDIKGNGTRLGRPPKPDRDEIILNNGFSKKQWDWYKEEAEKKGMDAMALVRVAAQWFMDSVEASRTGPIATLEDDKKFEQLIKKSKQSSKRNSRRK